MRKLLLVIILITGDLGIGFPQTKDNGGKTKGVIIAFYDEERLRSPAGEAAFQNFMFFLEPIRDIVKRDFPDVELKIVRRGELIPLPDRTRLNVQNIQPALGYILAAPGQKKRLLSGAQSETDFACAASGFFRRRSPACPK